MKGADSAMPIWADFMKEALQLHPEWNGDLAMPAGVRKAEIDIRNGLLIRELDAAEVPEVKATPTPTPSATPAIEGLDTPEWKTEQAPETKEMFVTNVPAEFRRVELFVAGTIPAREMMDTSAPVYDDGTSYPESETAEPNPSPSPTPLTNTWENQENRSNNSNSARRAPSSRERGLITVMVCPVTGLRVTSNCPGSEARTFKPGTEPKEFCTLHR